MNLDDGEVVNLLEAYLEGLGPQEFFCAWDIDLLHGALTRTAATTATDRQARVLYVEGQVRNGVRVCEVKKATLKAAFNKDRSTKCLMEQTYVNQGKARSKSMVLFYVIFTGVEGPREIVDRLRNVTSYEERLARSFEAACAAKASWAAAPIVSNNLVDPTSTFYDHEFARLYAEWHRGAEDCA